MCVTSLFFIAVAGLVDFLQQAAFKKWSNRIGVEIYRLEQELAASAEA
jgi:hypothetical protein